MHRPHRPPSCCLSPVPPVPNSSGVLTALLPFFILLHSLLLLLCWLLSRVGRVTNKGGSKGLGTKMSVFSGYHSPLFYWLAEWQHSGHHLFPVVMQNRSVNMKLSYTKKKKREREHGNGRWQIESRYSFITCVLKFLKLIFLRGSIPSKTQETNIHCTCFFSILRNYMQMTLRSINHIGFHFTKGWLYVNRSAFPLSSATSSLL